MNQKFRKNPKLPNKTALLLLMLLIAKEASCNYVCDSVTRDVFWEVLFSRYTGIYKTKKTFVLLVHNLFFVAIQEPDPGQFLELKTMSPAYIVSTDKMQALYLDDDEGMKKVVTGLKQSNQLVKWDWQDDIYPSDSPYVLKTVAGHVPTGFDYNINIEYVGG